MPAGDAPSRLVEALQSHATERSRRFWTGYVKGSPPFLGVPMAHVRREVAAWWSAEGLDGASPEERRAAALGLVRGTHAEERLAGILALAERMGLELDIEDLPRFVPLFEEGWLSDWNLTDWFCVKVLAAMIRDDPDPPAVARAVVDWRTAEPLWQRRAACVAFVPLAAEGGSKIPELPDLLEIAAEALVGDPERFAQTGVGWPMRELAKAEPERVIAFTQRNLERLSLEAIRSIGKGLEDGMTAMLVEAKKAAGARPG